MKAVYLAAPLFVGALLSSLSTNAAEASYKCIVEASMGIKMSKDAADMRPTKFKAPAYEYRIEPIETYWKKN
jgi:hypothetical protein